MTLCLCFFAVLYNPTAGTPSQSSAAAAMAASLSAQGMGARPGGSSFGTGQVAGFGNTLMSLPSDTHGTSLGTALQRATSLFTPEIKSNIVSVRSDERGIVISLASDAFFAPGSAKINIESTRDVLLRLGNLLASPEAAGRKFRIEGHTDNTPVTGTEFKDNWELSTARSISVLHYMTGLGIPENRFQVAGFADTMPVASNDTPQGRAYNRRVDVVILDNAHL
jgi:chemotaxis protein MotB